MENFIVVLLISYVIGSIPTSIIAVKLASAGDIRKFGSGNAGGTNVLRMLGWKIGVAVILFDLFKGVIATYYVPQIFWDPNPLPFNNATPFQDFTVVQIICGIVAVLGHIWTLFAGFKGGKGVATGAGMILGLAPVEFAVAMGVFAIVFLLWRYVSLGSILAAMAIPVSMFIRENLFHVDIPGYHTLVYFAIAVSMLITYTHRENIKRLLAGTENKLTHFKGTRK
ncbi:MAG TPA: acyl-phosphate glycerol 3-phosphate acyltransferase [Bacteroidetes bacterium]|nr:acyl-phosphate glycerol 3-phosphate acyltransferase [Bacteroidota bacterium]